MLHLLEVVPSCRVSGKMASKIEVKTTGALFDVAHDTLKSDAGALQGVFKYEYYPPFRLAGSTLEFQLNATEQSILQPRSLTDVSGQIKCYALHNLALTTKYFPGKKQFGATAKLNHSVAKRSAQSELKWARGKPVGGEFEMRLNPKNKLQIETIGTKADSVKWTLEKGLQQLKVKTIIPDKQLVLGMDALVKNQKWCVLVATPG
jgi:hypothetical protein